MPEYYHITVLLVEDSGDIFASVNTSERQIQEEFGDRVSILASKWIEHNKFETADDKPD